MKRRDFLKRTALSTGLAGLTAGLPALAAETDAAPVREFYELRRYQFRRGPMVKRFEDYWAHAALPALGRLGIGPVGVFSPASGPDTPAAYVLLPFRSLTDFTTLEERLAADSEHQQRGAEFLRAAATDPSYVRYESSLLHAFAGVPRLEVPAQKTAGQSRLFELRTYESHSKAANLKKIEMFNEGELAIFRRAGLAPVFFGETLTGPKLPNLTYLIVFDDMAAHDQCWGTFGRDPAWKKLSTTPGYTDAEIVCNISNIFLRPLACSQI
ncbi:MAG TPA: NIPSNAP family protein [Verrucomicrobiae bacterium]|nr:NIPSNAP family protein [Verrucomicrobiae bacterium]